MATTSMTSLIHSLLKANTRVCAMLAPHMTIDKHNINDFLKSVYAKSYEGRESIRENSKYKEAAALWSKGA